MMTRLKNLLISGGVERHAFDDAREELVKAKAEIDAIAEAEWYVLDRESMYSYMDYRGATERMDAISAIFPLFFFAVAALVCLTTMTNSAPG